MCQKQQSLLSFVGALSPIFALFRTLLGERLASSLIACSAVAIRKIGSR